MDFCTRQQETLLCLMKQYKVKVISGYWNEGLTIHYLECSPRKKSNKGGK